MRLRFINTGMVDTRLTAHISQIKLMRKVQVYIPYPQMGFIWDLPMNLACSGLVGHNEVLPVSE